MDAFYSIVGLLGAGCCVGMYALVSLGRISAEQPTFFVVNGIGALLVLLGSAHEFDIGDTGTIAQELVWAAISLAGATRAWWLAEESAMLRANTAREIQRLRDRVHGFERAARQRLRYDRVVGSLALAGVAVTMSSPAQAETLSDRAALLEPAMTIAKPEGDGPFPVVIQLHGCGGRSEAMMDGYAQAARDAGAAAVIVDSWTPRGISRVNAMATICTGARLRGRERAGDLYAAVAWARAQSWADPQRIIIAGWSHGGWTIMDGLALRSGDEMARATGLSDLPAEPLAGVAGAFIVYPYVGPPAFAGRRAWRINPQTLAIVGGRDLVVGRESPARALERLRSHGQRIDIHKFDTATHAFDDERAVDLRVRYDPHAVARARTLLTGLVQHVGASN